MEVKYQIQGRGVGLGLAICKSIVEAHGGKIKAINKKGGGAIFRFNIPKEINEVIGDESMDSNPYILVVEDDRPIRNFITAALIFTGV